MRTLKVLLQLYTDSMFSKKTLKSPLTYCQEYDSKADGQLVCYKN